MLLGKRGYNLESLRSTWFKFGSMKNLSGNALVTAGMRDKSSDARSVIRQQWLRSRAKLLPVRADES